MQKYINCSLNCNDTFDLKNPEAHPGVSAACPGGESAEAGKVEHKYYQWVCFTLFFQAILFYIPRLATDHIDSLTHTLLTLDISGSYGKEGK